MFLCHVVLTFYGCCFTVVFTVPVLAATNQVNTTQEMGPVTRSLFSLGRIGSQLSVKFRGSHSTIPPSPENTHPLPRRLLWVCHILIVWASMTSPWRRCGRFDVFAGQTLGSGTCTSYIHAALQRGRTRTLTTQKQPSADINVTRQNTCLAPAAKPASIQ